MSLSVTREVMISQWTESRGEI